RSEARYTRRRRQFHRHRRIHSSRTCFAPRDLSPRPLSRPRHARSGKITKWPDKNATSHQALGPELPGRLHLFESHFFAGGYHDLDALSLLQIPQEPCPPQHPPPPRPFLKSPPRPTRP